MMRKRWAWGSIFLWSALVLSGCAPVQVYSSSPSVGKKSNDYFRVELEPQLQQGQSFFSSFRFVFTNKTKKDLNLDWENTYYLFNGRRSGRFLWKGVDWEALGNIKNQPFIPVSPGDTVTAVIFPKKLVGRSKIGTATDLKYTRGPLPAGENGMLLVVKQNGRELREKIVVKIEAREG